MRSIPAAAWTVSVLAALVLPLAGCHVRHDERNGSDDVKVSIPFGGLNVNTNSQAVLNDIGLSAYPGATPDGDDKNNDSAAVNLNFGNFHIGVHVLSYRTPDAPDKVFAFYRKDLARYGQVIQCHDGQAVGSPAVTPQGLNCQADKDNHVGSGGHGSLGELKAGSRQRQHLVAVDQDDSGSKFTLVALELPQHTSDDKED